MPWRMNFRRKWLAVLYIYFEDFSKYSSPVTIADIYYRYARTLNDYNIDTLSAFTAHTNALRSFRCLYVVRDKEKPIHFPIPWEYLISVSGITKLTREGLIPVSEEQHFKARARSIARDYDIPVRS